MSKHFALTLCVLFFSLTNIVSADEVVLKNGSHLVGEVLKKQNDILEFKTPFAGVIKIKWKNIVEVKSDKPIKIMLKNDLLQMTNTLKSEDDVIKINNDNETQIQTIKMSEIAYINPEAWRLGEDYKITGGLNVSLESQHGNTETDEFDLDGVMTVRRKNDRLKFRGEYENDKSQDNRTALNWLLLGKYDYYITGKTYLGGTAVFEHDEFADLDLRETYGLHVGHQYFESKAINLSVEAGFAQVYEGFIKAKDDDFFAGTWRVNYDQYFYDEFVQLYHRHSGRLDLRDTNKYILKSWTGLRFPLVLGFSVSGEVQADYDSQPGPGVDKTDTTYLFKLGYNF
jgi:putative salt-induced outer membrane protein YdiY